MTDNADVFVPNGESRHDTAVTLLGAAHYAGLDPRVVRTSQSGFWIPSALFDAIQAQKGKAQPKKTSGNRAAKKPDTSKE